METNLSFEQLLTYARSVEAIRTYMTAMSAAVLATVSAVSSKKPSLSSECFNCGKQGHAARDPDCPARGKNVTHVENLDTFMEHAGLKAIKHRSKLEKRQTKGTKILLRKAEKVCFQHGKQYVIIVFLLLLIE